MLHCNHLVFGLVSPGWMLSSSNNCLFLTFCLACFPLLSSHRYPCVRSLSSPTASLACACHSTACCHLRSSHLNAAILSLRICEFTCMRVCFLEHSPETFFLLPYLFSSLCSLLSCARYVVTANQQVLDCQQAHVSCSSYPKVVPLHVVHLHVAAVAHLMFESFHF